MTGIRLISSSLLSGCVLALSSAAADAATKPLVAADPCSLLTTAEVRRVFPDAKPGVRERTREQYGISACVWNYTGGSFALQLWIAKPGAVDTEIRGLAQGYMDPMKPASDKVRYETIAGIGDKAMAVVEARDEKHGVLNDMAMLIAQRGDRLMELQAADLASRDRAAALAVLTGLGKTAIAKL